jgi:hypothetical protein
MRLLVVLPLALVVTACGHTNRWQEEVQLSDGTVLTVDRAVRFGRLDMSVGQSRDARPANEEWLTFTDPATGHDIEWHQPRRIATWIDRIDGHYWVVGRVTAACDLGYGGRPYWAVYVLRGSKWIEVDAADAPAITQPNLLLSTGNYGVTKRLAHVSSLLKKQLDEDSMRRDPRNRSIDLSYLYQC